VECVRVRIGASIVSLVCAATIAAAAARAQDDAPSTRAFEPAPARLSLRVEPMLWYLGPGGEVDMPGSATTSNAPEADLDLLGFDTPRWTPMPEVHVEWAEWRLAFRGYAFSGDHNSELGFAGEVGTVAFGPTTTLRSSLDMSSFEMELAREVYHFPGEVKGEDRPDFLGIVEVLGGVRVFDVDWSIARTNASGPPLVGTDEVRADEVFVEPVIGARLEMLFGEEFGIDWQFSLGGMMSGDRTSGSGDVIVGGWWKPHPNVGVQIGYRAAFFDLTAGEDADEFRFSGSNQGVQVGVILTF
jgi:hypothetical protein